MKTEFIRDQMVALTPEQESLKVQFENLFEGAGTHSPSIQTLYTHLPDLKIKVDACFLSNPYATQLFIDNFTERIIEKDKLRELLEFYPSQNEIIAGILARSLQLDSANIFIGNGAIEIIQAILHNFKVKKIAIVLPTFSSYYEFLKDDTEVVYYNLAKENNFNLDIEDYIKFVERERPDTIVLINPNNPTGNYLTREATYNLVNRLSFVDNIILDESFIHFAFEDDNLDDVTFSDMVAQFENVMIVKSMSKDFGIAGIRAGYAIMAKSRVDSLLKNGFLWNSNGLAEHFFRLYSDPEFLSDYQVVRKRYIMDTQEFVKDLSKIKQLNVYSSSANFVLVELPEQLSARELTSILLIKYGVYVRNCDDKIGLDGNFIRIASRGKEENSVIIAALKNVFNG